MYSIILFLLIGGLSTIIIGRVNPAPTITNKDIQKLIRSGRSIAGSNYNLKVSGEIFAETETSVVFKGLFNNTIPVAIKVIGNEYLFNHEIYNLAALEATNDSYPNIESEGIPRIYYHGKVLGGFNAIAMSLFDGTLEELFQQQGFLSDTSILLIFKQAVQALQYIHSKNILHNDIKPANIFLRGSKVFISDFSAATRNDEESYGQTEQFASSSWYAGVQRHYMDDLESLIYLIWYVAGVPSDPSFNAEGCVIFEKIQIGEAESHIKEKCKHFEDRRVYEAFKQVCKHIILARDSSGMKPVPKYKRITDALTKALAALKREFGPPEDVWLTTASSSSN